MIKLKNFFGNVIHALRVRRKLKNDFCVRLNNLHKKKKKVLILVNVPLHGNLGDQAIAFAEKKYIREIFNEEVLEFTDEEFKYGFTILKKFIKDEDILFVLGGGNFGSLWKFTYSNMLKVFKTFSRNNIFVFPQTAYFEDNKKGIRLLRKTQKVLNKSPKVILCARETQTFDLFKKYFSNQVLLIPDIVLTLHTDWSIDRKHVLMCFRKDKEKSITDENKKQIYALLNNRLKDVDIQYTDTVLQGVVRQDERKIKIYEKLREFSSAKLIVTDRLHGMIFSAITKTPCIFFNNFDGKVFRVYSWIDNLDYIKCINSLDEFYLVLNCVLNTNSKFELKTETQNGFSLLKEKLEECYEKI